MTEQFNDGIEQKFKTPEEELNYLRAKVSSHEQALANKGEDISREEIIKKEIIAHSDRKPEEILDKNYALKRQEVEGIVLDLSPEAHDEKMGELVNILQDKGVLNALSVVDKLKDPHIEDDFHRFLVQYIKSGFRLAGNNEKSPIFKALKMTLFEISLPGINKDETQKSKNLKEIISKMEQFYSGMLSVENDDVNGAGYFVLELTNANHSNEIIFYIAVPDSKKSLFEKQIQSIFSDVKLEEKKDDYNVFNEAGDFVGSYAEFGADEIFPIKTYDNFDYDPLNVLLNSFSKVNKDGEGAAVQIIIKPNSSKMELYKRVLKEVEKGSKLKEAYDKADTSFLNIFKQVGKEIITPNKKKDDEKKPTESHQNTIENIKAKISAPLASVNIRIIASSGTREEAGAILSEKRCRA